MSFLSFPDLNVWLALATSEHAHSAVAHRWWNHHSGPIAFSRLTQIGFLRLVTTAAAMDGKPLSLAEAWNVHDHFFKDDRVVFAPEPAEVDAAFRQFATGATASPKMWADAWLLAFAHAAGGTLITFDRALAKRGARCILGNP